MGAGSTFLCGTMRGRSIRAQIDGSAASCGLGAGFAVSAVSHPGRMFGLQCMIKPMHNTVLAEKEAKK